MYVQNAMAALLDKCRTVFRRSNEMRRYLWSGRLNYKKNINQNADLYFSIIKTLR